MGIAEYATKYPLLLFFILGTFHRDTYKRIKKLIQPQDFILDIGALDSPYTVYFPNRVVAVDLPQKGIFGFSVKVKEKLRSRRNLTPIIASGEALPFRNQIFNKIVCTEVIEHIHDDETAVSEMARVLKNEGKAFLTTPNEDAAPLEQGIKEHIRHYTSKKLHTLLSQSFSEVIVEERFQHWQLLRTAIILENKWHKAKFQIQFLLASIISSWLYDFMYLSGIPQRGYNLTSICSNP